MKYAPALTLAIAIGFAGAPLTALAGGDHGGGHPTKQSSAAPNGAGTSHADAMTEGEVKKVNKETGKITIKHSELKNLDMPAMTMVFQVKDPAMLDQVKPGDKVSFMADKVDGKFTIAHIEAKN